MKRFKIKFLSVLLSGALLVPTVAPFCVSAKTLEEFQLTEDTRGYGGFGTQDKEREEKSIKVHLTLGNAESEWNDETNTSNLYPVETVFNETVEFGDYDNDGDIDSTDLLKYISESNDLAFESDDSAGMGDFYLTVCGCEANGDYNYTVNDFFCQAGTPDLYDGDDFKVYQIMFLQDEFQDWGSPINNPKTGDVDAEDTDEEDVDEDKPSTGTKYDEEIAELKRQLELCDIEISEYTDRINALIEQINQLEEEFNLKSITAEELQSEYDNLYSTLESLLKEYDKFLENQKDEEARKQVEDLRDQLAKKKSDIDDLAKQEKSLLDRIEEIKKAISEKDSIIDKIKAAIEAIKEQIKEILAKLGYEKVPESTEVSTEVSRVLEPLDSVKPYYLTKMHDRLLAGGKMTKTDWQQALILKENGMYDDQFKGIMEDSRKRDENGDLLGIVADPSGKINKLTVNGLKGTDILREMVCYEDVDSIYAFLSIDGLIDTMGMYAVDYVLAYLDYQGYYLEGEEMAPTLDKDAVEASSSQRDDAVYYIVNTSGIWNEDADGNLKSGGFWTYDTGSQNLQALVPYYNTYPEVKARIDKCVDIYYNYFMNPENTGDKFDASSSSEFGRFLSMMGAMYGGDYAQKSLDIYNKVYTMPEDSSGRTQLEATKFHGNSMDEWRMARQESYLLNKFSLGEKVYVNSTGEVKTYEVDSTDIYGVYKTVDDSGEHIITIAQMGQVNQENDTTEVEIE